MKLFLLPGALAAWAALCAWLSFKACGLVDGPRRTLVKALLFAALLPLPILDELLAQPQFAALCRSVAVMSVHDPLARNLAVDVVAQAPEALSGLPVTVSLHRWLFVDAATQRPIVSFNTLHATGGRLASLLGGASSSAPFTFTGDCEPPDKQRVLATLALQFGAQAAP